VEREEWASSSRGGRGGRSTIRRGIREEKGEGEKKKKSTSPQGVEGGRGNFHSYEGGRSQKGEKGEEGGYLSFSKEGAWREKGLDLRPKKTSGSTDSEERRGEGGTKIGHNLNRHFNGGHQKIIVIEKEESKEWGSYSSGKKKRGGKLYNITFEGHEFPSGKGEERGKEVFL